ncbi:hypothetical protein [Bordetella petrii]|uniref:Secreted protein n=1 Tax=Bordetella petrii (strain ATCC BAA-461 / DSM 12804 / CCUG 43448 / CIP 107267 / Se-1111R) TaxID=340100 RepID=A9HWY5_BORPD|nr:hypothetical protein [Bordetella petrii]CAP43675.1 hypothetical protein predicted by Glimmer/Critica [Bordetella petrii]
MKQQTWKTCIAMAMAANAAAAGTPANDTAIAERCQKKSALSGVLLTIKQHGGTIAEMMSVTGNDEKMRALITQVHDEERYYSEVEQQQMAARLAERIYSECMAGRL